MAKNDTALILESVITHIDGVLTGEGWTVEVVPGGEIDSNTEPPVVGVQVTDERTWGLESGSVTLATEFRFEVIVYADTDGRMDDLKDVIIKNLHGIDIINFNTAMPGDVGYDADAQRLAGGHATGVRSSVVDRGENIVKITFELQPDATVT